MTNVHTSSSIKTHHNLICHKNVIKWYIFLVCFILFLPFINIVDDKRDDEEAKIKLFGINIFNMWHTQSSFCKKFYFGVHKTVYKQHTCMRYSLHSAFLVLLENNLLWIKFVVAWLNRNIEEDGEICFFVAIVGLGINLKDEIVETSRLFLFIISQMSLENFIIISQPSQSLIHHPTVHNDDLKFHIIYDFTRKINKSRLIFFSFIICDDFFSSLMIFKLILQKFEFFFSFKWNNFLHLNEKDLFFGVNYGTGLALTNSFKDEEFFFWLLWFNFFFCVSFSHFKSFMFCVFAIIGLTKTSRNYAS